MHKQNKKENQMRTTLDLPSMLIDEAMQFTHIKTKTGVIIQALEDFIRKNKIKKLKKYRGSLNLDINLSTLRDRK